jgi:hypothetical protein
MGVILHVSGVTDRGYPNICTLSEQFFSNPSDLAILTESSSFWEHGLATFLLSMIQVISFLGNKEPVEIDPSEPFPLPCDECLDKRTHHLYLQACLEIGSACMMYIELGFMTLAVGGGSYHCESYHYECPIKSNRKFTNNKKSYHTDDDCICLLVLKKWLHNVFPANPLLTIDMATTISTLWNQPGTTS